MPDAQSFWAMGGYAAYVWPAYAIALIVLGTVAAVSVTRLRRIERALEQLQGGPRRRGGRPVGAGPAMPAGPQP